MENKIEKNTDEIDLLELASVIWRWKYFIAAFVAIVSVITVIAVLLIDNEYESKAVLKPTASSSSGASGLGGLGTLAGLAGISLGSESSISSDISVLMQNKAFFANFIKKNNFQQKLLDDPEIMKTDDYKNNETFALHQSVYKRISVVNDKSTGYISVSFRHKDPAFAKEFISALLVDMSSTIKQQDMANIDKRIDNYKLEIDRAADFSLKTKLSEFVASLIQSKVMANADEYYGFSIASAPSAPDMKDKVYPKRAQICIISFFAACVISILGVFVIEYVQNFRKARLTKEI
mgnify:CR=1 FL=1